MPPPLLVLSNGHGEDLIALRVVEALLEIRPRQAVVVMPLVGLGSAFQAAADRGRVQLQGPRRGLPSGGFSNQSLTGLGRDLLAGLPLLSWQQWRWLRRWASSEPGAPVLAVGDLLPLLLAWGSGAPYGFIGTPKSDFTWASPTPEGWPSTPLADAYHQAKGSEWDPWEWGLMRHRRCRLVAVRDGLTARGLRRRQVAARAPGNPMQDGFTPALVPPPSLAERQLLLLLPGSRVPECLRNAERLLRALAAWQPDRPTTVLLAGTARPDQHEWQQALQALHLEPQPLDDETSGCGAVAAWRRGPLEVLLGHGCFQRWAPWADVGLATAGTATEQLAGLGVPVLSLPGPGPQFTAGFARRQSRLLGGAVHPCRSPGELIQHLAELLNDGARRQALGRIGRRRMGPAGGSARLAALVERQLLPAAGGSRLG